MTLERRRVQVSSHFQKLRRDEGGAAAVEFAFIGPLFLAMIFSLLEMGFYMTRIATLDNAVADAAKFIYTGAASTGSPDQEDVEEFICGKAFWYSKCRENITVEVVPVTDFTGTTAGDATCQDSEDNDDIKPTVTYNPGSSSQIVLLRVCLTANTFTPGLQRSLGMALVDTETNRTQIVSTIAFMNEPF